MFWVIMIFDTVVLVVLVVWVCYFDCFVDAVDLVAGYVNDLGLV